MGHQLSLSFELICLLDWLIKNKEEELCELIAQAVESDFTTALDEEIDDSELLERLYNGVIDFVAFFEETLIDEFSRVVKEQGDKGPSKGVSANLKAKLASLVEGGIPRQELRSGVPLEEPRPPTEFEKEFFKKLLERWEPGSNETVN